jgi:Pyruvate/2-oxoacid:ferredoxin oxidoreductase gamma subunit
MGLEDGLRFETMPTAYCMGMAVRGGSVTSIIRIGDEVYGSSHPYGQV